jgi:hypothetical protein
MITQTILMPAYGRTYATKEAALAAWADEMDFRIVGFGARYVSIRDMKHLKPSIFDSLYIRLDNIKLSITL